MKQRWFACTLLALAACASGQQGQPGAAGEQGRAGAAGPSGGAGADGIQGPPGPQGAAGAQGATGQAGVDAIAPAGAVVAFAGQKAPAGWLACDGAEVSRTTYASLFSAIGTSHGAGDGATTFRVPDYRGRFLRGTDQGTGRDPNAKLRAAMNSGGATGDAVGSLQSGATALPSANFITSVAGDHSHQAPTWNGVSGAYEAAQGAYGYDFGGNAPPTTVNGAHTHAITSGGDSETRPLNANVTFIVRY